MIIKSVMLRMINYQVQKRKLIVLRFLIKVPARTLQKHIGRQKNI